MSELYANIKQLYILSSKIQTEKLISLFEDQLMEFIFYVSNDNDIIYKASDSVNYFDETRIEPTFFEIINVLIEKESQGFGLILEAEYEEDIITVQNNVRTKSLVYSLKITGKISKENTDLESIVRVYPGKIQDYNV